MNSAAKNDFVEDVELHGHIIDSLMLPKILDLITATGGQFRIRDMHVGQRRQDPSNVLIEVKADSQGTLDRVIATISDHGALPTSAQDCTLVAADEDGAFPEGFHCSTNQRTEIRVSGQWIPVQPQEMDCGIVYEHEKQRAHCVPMVDVQRGQCVVVGHAGVRTLSDRHERPTDAFEFMSSAVSTEKPKGVAIRGVAESLYRMRQEGGRTLLVGGPAVVHTGSSDYLCDLIRDGYISRLFAGNALATHDIEQAMFGTSLGVRQDNGEIVESGHEHHLRAINRIRRVGGIHAAVRHKVLTRGIMYECVMNDVPFMLAGSIRDDGPLPDVVTDMIEAQQTMRDQIRDVDFCLMIATTLHSIAVGNLLPATTSIVCVDINPSTVIKLQDRGSTQTVGLVTDVAPFLRQLSDELKQIERGGG